MVAEEREEADEGRRGCVSRQHAGFLGLWAAHGCESEVDIIVGSYLWSSLRYFRAVAGGRRTEPGDRRRRRVGWLVKIQQL